MRSDVLEECCKLSEYGFHESTESEVSGDYLTYGICCSNYAVGQKLSNLLVKTLHDLSHSGIDLLKRSFKVVAFCNKSLGVSLHNGGNIRHIFAQIIRSVIRPAHQSISHRVINLRHLCAVLRHNWFEVWWVNNECRSFDWRQCC